MELGIKLCLIALAALSAILLFRGHNPQGAFLLAAVVCIFIVAQTLPALVRIYDYCKGLIAYTGLDPEVFAPLAKVIGLAICVRITTELCRDAGERAIAAKVEMAGAAVGLICALPLLEQAVRLIGGL